MTALLEPNKEELPKSIEETLNHLYRCAYLDGMDGIKRSEKRVEGAVALIKQDREQAVVEARIHELKWANTIRNGETAGNDTIARHVSEQLHALQSKAKGTESAASEKPIPIGEMVHIESDGIKMEVSPISKKENV